MKITIQKGKKATEIKGMLSSREDVLLTVQISVALEPEEQELIKKYYEPAIPAIYELEDRDFWKEAEIKITGKNFSNYSISAQFKHGFQDLVYAHSFLKQIKDDLASKIRYLRELDKWQGEEVEVV